MTRDRTVARLVRRVAALAAVGVFTASAAAQPARPNIVLIFPDNLGLGRGRRLRQRPRRRSRRASTRWPPRACGSTNFNVEFSCTVSRAALMTGRYAIRSGATQAGGMTLWEVTLAEALKSVGYATALFGKWHLGGDRPEGREPSRQGFDEYYGIPRTSNEAQTTIAQGQKTPGTSFIWERHAPAAARDVKPFDMDTRRTVDRESADRGIDFMERQVKAKRPFFLYYPMTQIHFPTLAHPDFAGKIGRRRRRRRDGGDGLQRRAGARRHRAARHHAQHDGAVVHRQRARAAPAVARIARAVVAATTTA